MKQKLILLFFTLLLWHSVTAQDENSRFIHSIGCSFVTDYMQAPATVYTKVGNSGYEEQFIDQYKGLAIFTLQYNCRFNMIELSDEIALSVSLTPAAGVFVTFNGDAEGYGSLNFPLMVGLETGAGSTYKSTAGLGAYIRYGVEWTKAPLVTKTDEFSEYKFESSWVEPVAQFGVRFWNKQNKLQEINLKYGFGAAVPSGEYSEDSAKPSRATTIRISWLMFINY